MVFTDAVRGGWSRRAVLGAVGAGLVSVLPGCSVWDRSRSAAPPPDPLEPLLATTRALAARYEAALEAHPDLAERLGPPHEAHLAHEAALLAVIGRPELATPSAETGVWSPPTAESAGAEETVTELREAELAGEEQARQACLAAPPDRAPLLGSIAAARATHAAVLS